MKVIHSAGPRTRLQLVRYRVDEVGTADRRYAVHLIQDDGVVTLATSKHFKPADDVFDTECMWRGWMPRQEEPAP